MAEVERKQSVQDILKDMRGLEGLKRLFWQELNYERENKPLSTRLWPESAKSALAEDPVLFASGGEENAFHIVYCRLDSASLKRVMERSVVSQLLRDHPYALFVFSDKDQSAWDFLNVKYDEQAEKRRLTRRIAVRANEGLRTAAERLAMLDLQTLGPELFNLTPIVIQQRHDEAFDVERVTKDFYREIANWYFWALKHASFPEGARKEDDGHDHISVIRLITRLIFCWFIREKGLIPDALFERRRLAAWLDGFAPDTPDDKASVFYRAILQNLFFATLNTEMDKRSWRREGQNLMAHNLYRHKTCFRDPMSALALFKDIPFLNGGLFECLDRDFGEGAKPRYLRIDGFSDRADSQPTVPDYLFFGPEQEVDLSADYGDKKFKKVRVRGLIDTLNRYKFTIEENTPFDQEVALDPEMSGKVFENLLAAYNPETGTTARKATGSFYTPREIVDYMVDESLAVYLNGKLESQTRANKRESSGSATSVATKSKTVAPERVTIENEPRIRALLAYDESLPEFSEAETERLLDAIDNLKALDPAVGSGAFPMGLLHKLVHVLGKLDPDNEKWKAKQIAKIDDVVMREEAERVFRDNYDNYGRKLFLIENCIYGVDIQPIAVQIAKMRFFISLIVDQKINDAQPNRGVRPLPNLETKFVAANTLIDVNRPGQQLLRNRDIDIKEAELRRVRERYFVARTPKQKAKCRDDDANLRAEIAELLKGDGWDTTTARRLAAWNPYDQNASADFFEPEWMFGLTGGFNLCIGNPPYGLLNKRQNKAEAIVATEEELAYYKSCPKYQPAQGGMLNIFRLFILRSIHLLQANGSFCEIFPLAFLGDSSAASLRRWVFEECCVNGVEAFPERDNPNKRVFEAAKMSVCILSLQRHKCPSRSFFIRINGDRFVDDTSPRTFLSLETLRVLDKTNLTIPLLTLQDLRVLTIIYSRSVRIADIGHCYTGEVDLTLGKQYISQDPSDAVLLRGAAIDRYMIRREMRQGDFLFLKAKKYLSEVGGKKASHFQMDRIGMQGITGVNEKTRLKATIVPAQVFCANSVNYVAFDEPAAESPKFVLAVLNSRLLNYVFSKFSTNSNVNGYEVDNLPIPIAGSDQRRVIEDLASTLLWLYGQRVVTDGHNPRDTLMVTFWDQVVNALVYELFFPDELHSAGLRLFDLVVAARLPMADGVTDGNCLEKLRQCFERLHDVKHPLYAALYTLSAVDVVRIIEGEA